MKTFFILITICLVSAMVSSSPLGFNYRTPTTQQRHVQQMPLVQGGVKGHPSQEPALRHLTKGEYYCGNKICKLTPGEIPKGCNGICQYPL